ncbi:hypothetical protein ACOME3_007201 [Neoechinorhynchus agilis]
MSSILKDNPYFGAGFGLFAVGLCAASARRVGRYVAWTLKRRYITTLELTSSDQCYMWVLDHLNSHFGPRGPAHLAIGNQLTKSGSGALLVPSVGIHFVQYEGRWIRIERKREKVTHLGTGGLFETMTLSAIGTSGLVTRKMFENFIRESIRRGLNVQHDHVIVYTPYINEWRPFGPPKSKRSLESVVLDVGIREKIVKDVQEFIRSRQWYSDRGVPYRRGYLLHGPPGCGKSSFIYALAGTLTHIAFN